MRRLVLTLLASFVVVACQESAPPTALDSLSPDAAFSAQAAGAQLQDYIVVFNDDVNDPSGLARGLVNANGGSLRHTYELTLKGFAASLPPQAVQALQNNPNVAYIEPDFTATIVGTENNATWGLDRIDQRDLPLDDTYVYDYDGTGVTAYILDTGIRITHNEFGGRASYGYDAVDGDFTSGDCHGHGTHVAGTVGGATYGVAQNVSLVAVRVLNCSGSGSYGGIIAGIEWVTADANGSPAVINMSLGGPASQSLNTAIAGSVAQGVVHAVAAGNESTDACSRSPASAPEALTAGSTTISDTRSSFSNYGTCVDLFAPGSGILSASYTSDSGTTTKSGTSMASPHVAGAAALILDMDLNATPAQVEAIMESFASVGKVGNPGSGSPNLLLYTRYDGTPPPPPPPPVDTDVEVASNTVSVSGNKRKKGVAQVRIEVVGSNTGVANATVTGDWSGDYDATGVTGVTDASGNVTFQTPNQRNIPGNFTFCVTAVTGSNLAFVPGVPDDCATVGDSGGGGGDPSPLGTLSVNWKTKGKVRADLSWTGGGASVDVIENGGTGMTINNTGSYRDNSPGTSYQVCEVGETSPDKCTNTVSNP